MGTQTVGHDGVTQQQYMRAKKSHYISSPKNVPSLKQELK